MSNRPSPTRQRQGEATLCYDRVSKAFGSTVALHDVDLAFEEGRIHALVGENGAGKSTCLGVAAGRVEPTSGAVSVFGRPLAVGKPRASREAGIACIHQELMMAPALDAAANVFLGRPIQRRGLIARGRMWARYVALCGSIGVEPAPRGMAVGHMPLAEQQIIEILRALAAEARIILFDEPTASLGPGERTALLGLMRSLAAEGITMAFVSHFLEEVLEVADDISVFRDGRLVATARQDAWDKASLVEAMLGADAHSQLGATMLQSVQPTAPAAATSEDASPARPRAAGVSGPVLRVQGLTVTDAIHEIDFEVRSGEILGVAGLVGAGRTSLLRALAGAERAEGRIWVEGREVRWPRTVRRSRQFGIGFSPEDRKGAGLVLQVPAMHNIAIADGSAAGRFGFLSRKSVEKRCGEAARACGFPPSRLRDRTADLSGGNQQKLLIARWMYASPKVILMDEPTRGVDIGAKQQIREALESMAAHGVAIVLVSSEFEEVASMSDRVLVLAHGHIAATYTREHGAIVVSDLIKAAFDFAGERYVAA